MSEQTAENDLRLMASRRGIVHALKPGFPDQQDAETLCGKWSRDLVHVGSVGVGQRMCQTCSARAIPAEKTSDDYAGKEKEC